MKQAVIEDWDKFNAFLAAQPLCRWAAQKEHELAMGMHLGSAMVEAPRAKKNDNAALAAALSSMA
jgi:hypothetical protein